MIFHENKDHRMCNESECLVLLKYFYVNLQLFFLQKPLLLTGCKRILCRKSDVISMKSFESMYCCRAFIANTSSHCKVNCFRLYSKLFKFHELIMMELLVVTSVMNMLSHIKFLHQAKTTATIMDKICCTFFGNNIHFFCAHLL